MNKRKPTAKLPALAGKSQREVPMIWDFPEDLESKFVTNMLVQSGEQEFFVSFFEVAPPLIFLPEDVQKIENMRAHCIGRFVISPERIEKFIKVLQQQLKAFNEKKARQNESE